MKHMHRCEYRGALSVSRENFLQEPILPWKLATKIQQKYPEIDLEETYEKSKYCYVTVPQGWQWTSRSPQKHSLEFELKQGDELVAVIGKDIMETSSTHHLLQLK